MLPKRVRDLTPLKVDSESEEDHQNRSPYEKRWAIPRRTVELSPYKSDSDDENNLNSARLTNNSGDCWLTTPPPPIQQLSPPPVTASENLNSKTSFFETKPITSTRRKLHNPLLLDELNENNKNSINNDKELVGRIGGQPQSPLAIPLRSPSPQKHQQQRPPPQQHQQQQQPPPPQSPTQNRKFTDSTINTTMDKLNSGQRLLNRRPREPLREPYRPMIQQPTQMNRIDRIEQNNQLPQYRKMIPSHSTTQPFTDKRSAAATTIHNPVNERHISIFKNVKKTDLINGNLLQSNINGIVEDKKIEIQPETPVAASMNRKKDNNNDLIKNTPHMATQNSSIFSKIPSSEANENQLKITNEFETPQRPQFLPNTIVPSTSKHFTNSIITKKLLSTTKGGGGGGGGGGGLLSTKSNRSKASIHDEFQSNKILFTTPISISSCPPPLENSSLMNFSLDASMIHLNNNTKLQPPLSSSSSSAAAATSGSSSNVNTINNNNNNQSNKVDNSLISSTSNLSINSTTNTTEDPDLSIKTLTINGKSYVIKKKIGSGGSSSVFLTLLKSNKENQDCAVKVVDLQGDPAVISGYLNETKLLAKLQGSDCVIKMLDYEHIPCENLLYMVMEMGETDLHKILQTYTENMPLISLLTYWHQILLAVDYIHKNGVIHSDLKPANFLLVKGRLKLIDFGIASNISVDSTSIIKMSLAGTFNYISPEALLDTSTGDDDTPTRQTNQPKIKISTKSDVWSLGCILYLFVYRKTPFGHIKNFRTKMCTIGNPSTKIDYPTIPIYYPQLIVEIMQKCLVFNPKMRLSASDLLKNPYKKILP